MIVEQLSLAHFSLGLLSCKAANAVKVEAVGVYSGAAARLMGEFRADALALQAYRRGLRTTGCREHWGPLRPVRRAGGSGRRPRKNP